MAPEEEITVVGGGAAATPREQDDSGSRTVSGGVAGKNQVHPAPAAPIAQAAAPPPQSLVLPPSKVPAAAWEIAPHEKRLEAHGEIFIPFRVAKSKVIEVENDMRTLRGKHMRIIEQVEGQYKEIAREQEQYYLAYIQRLNAAAQHRDQQQCELLASIRSEADSYRRFAEAKCQELEEEIAALKGDIGERDAYITKTQDAFEAMQREVRYMQ